MVFLNRDFGLFFHLDEILVCRQDDQLVVSMQKIYGHECSDDFEKNACFLEIFDEKNLYAVEISLEALKNDREFYFLPVRTVLGKLDPKSRLFKLICRAKQLLHWHKVSRFCGECGGINQLSEIETAKICQQCQKVTYPYYHLAILVLIEREDEILLARSPHFAKGLYAPLAGFISPAESAEEAVAREVYEEVGLEIKDIRYFANQSWPFPNSFMIGYFAKYASGKICVDTNELEDARWFGVTRLPTVMPSKASISRQLIEHFLNRR